jgi:DNA-binding helix-hairpin-helix protein with protein kinase domain
MHGAVYRIADGDGGVVKLFRGDSRERKADKIRAMVRDPPVDPTYAMTGIRSICWPEAVATDPNTGTFVGYRMPRVPISDGRDAQKHAATRLSWDQSESAERLRTARTLAGVVHAIHRQGHGIGNFDHQKFLVGRDGHVSVVNCDEFAVRGEDETYASRAYHQRYTPPEGPGEVVSDIREADRFGLAVHVFQFLMAGFHPHVASGAGATPGSVAEQIRENPFPYDTDATDIHPPDSAPEYDQLPQAVRQLFQRCFARDADGSDLERPTAAEWIDVLTDQLAVMNRSPSG